jgi:hypothetical protein
MATWRFRKHLPGEPVRNPIQGEFFSTEAIANAAEALVREGIQNSLDARLGDDPVTVRIYVSGASGSLTRADISDFAQNLWPHVGASRNGLSTPPRESESCPFLCFEDFGTTGLNGSPEEAYLDDGDKNGFYTFFRAEGLSQKDTKDLGRWGVGKTVFPRASRAGVFFGSTVRSDDGQRLLMGRGTLKFHRTADGEHFTSDGYFGQHRSGVTFPLTDAGRLDLFASRFRLKRATESGLSIVVPWCEPDIDFDQLALATVRGYFVPILKGELHVQIDSPERSIELNATTLVESLATLTGDIADLAAWIDLTKIALGYGASDHLQVSGPPAGAHKWQKDLLSPALAATIRQCLGEGHTVPIRVPVNVRPHGGTPTASFFDVYLKRDERYDDGRALFVREGIIVSDVRSSRTRKIRALVIVQDDPLATLLGDSENPAHTQWQKDSSNFKGKYVYGPSYIEFVTSAPSRLVRFITEDDTERNMILAREFFSILQQDAPPITEIRSTTRPGGRPPSPVTPRPRQPQLVRIAKIEGGFALRPGDADATGCEFTLRAAYDVRRGNPFAKYSEEDFQVGTGDIEVSEQFGIELVRTEQNLMRVRVTAPEFSLKITGFDENRDLVVRATENRNEA